MLSQTTRHSDSTHSPSSGACQSYKYGSIGSGFVAAPRHFICHPRPNPLPFPSLVKRILATTALLLGWLCANGALLDTLQVVAWSRMFASNTGTMSVSAALQETFNPQTACSLCKHVAKAKETAQQQLPLPGDSDSAAPKFVLVLDTVEPSVFARDPGNWIASPSMRVCQRTEPVPVPPPRV